MALLNMNPDGDKLLSGAGALARAHFTGTPAQRGGVPRAVGVAPAACLAMNTAEKRRRDAGATGGRFLRLGIGGPAFAILRRREKSQ